MISGYEAFTLCNHVRCAPNLSVVKQTDIKNISNAKNQKVANKTDMDFVKDYICNNNMLKSDDKVISHGTLATPDRALLTSKHVLNALKERHPQKKAEIAARASNAANVEARKREREKKVAEKARQKAAAEQEKELLLILSQNRACR